MKDNYFVFYNNGHFEVIDAVNPTWLHMIEVGVVKVIYDCQDKKVWNLDSSGKVQNVVATFTMGLSV